MKNNKVITSLLLSSLFISYPCYAFASEVEQDRKTSAVEIEVVPKTLFMNEISAPVFGEYTIQEDGLSLPADSDFVIHIEDKRESRGDPWIVYYQVGVFTNENGVQVPAQQVSIGNGILSAEGKPLETSDYESYKVDTKDSDMSPLVKVHSDTYEAYEYRVPKENISISLTGDLHSGTYTAVQSVYLASVPINE